MNRFIELRQLLHRQPELAGNERDTSKTIVRFLKLYNPDRLITGLGGYGIAAVFNGLNDGPRVLVRCELDALPIHEESDLSYRSRVSNVSHKCGHDGHMAILVGLAECLRKNPPKRGSVVLLFQPAEETGEGAARILEDSQFEQIEPDYVLALHNLPGFELGEVIIKSGVFASASVGVRIHLTGKTSHAAEPENGVSPALAVAQLIQILSSVPQFHTSLHDSAQVTIINANVGEEAFGTSPGEGIVMATLRSHSQDTIELLKEKVNSLASRTADIFGLEFSIDFVQPFPMTKNDSSIADTVVEVVNESSKRIRHPEIPFAWSEDFGHFTSKYRGVLFGLGSGEDHPALHHPDYDFPDQLIESGSNLFESIIHRLLGRDNV